MGEAVELPQGTVTFWFTDVVGSTRLWERAPVAMGDALKQHDDLVEQAVAEHGGQLVRPRGEGDSRFAVFVRASDAVRAAGRLRRLLADAVWSTPEPIRVRMSLLTGEADLRAGDYYGSAVNRCARLRSLAAPGQILLSHTVSEIVIDTLEAPFALVELGAYSLADLSRPETIFELVDQDRPEQFPPLVSTGTEPTPAAGTPVSLPVACVERGDGAGLDAFVGRDDVVGRVMGALGKVDNGGARLVLVSGPAGIGKTRLTMECARRAHAAGATVLYGRADEDLGLPYQPWVEALGHLVHEAPGLVARSNATVLGRLVPAARERATGLPSPAFAIDGDGDGAETERYLLFGAVADLLTEAAGAAGGPVVVVLDDLHWSEKATLSLLRHLVLSPSDAGLLIIGTYRDTDIDRGHPLTDALASLWREPEVERIALEGLDEAALFELLETVAGYQVDDDVHDLAAALGRETGGNPFFAREILRHLIETGAIYRENDRWHANFELADARLPSSVREVVGQRLARLGEDTVRVLATAAVIGREFDLGLLAALTAQSEEDLLDLLDVAVAAAVVEELPAHAERFGFSHALIQRTLYEDLGAARRGRAHRRIAEALEAEVDAGHEDRVGELAHHWAAATAPVQAAKAVDYARRAGQRALASLAPDEALRWFTQALELLGEDPDQAELRCDLHIDLGVAQLQAGMADHRQTLLGAAAEAAALHDTERLVRAALANNRGSESSAGEIDRDRVAVLRDALDSLGPAATASRARLLSNLGLELTYETDATNRRELVTEAVALARQLDDPATLLYCLNAWNSSLRLPDTFAERLVTTREAVALAQGLDDAERAFSAHRQLLQAALESSDRPTADQATAAMHDIAVRTRHPRLVWVDLQNRALGTLQAGDLATADDLVEEALQKGSALGQPDALTVYVAELFDLRTHQGRTAEIVDTLLAAIPEMAGIPALTAAVAHALIDAQRTDEAGDLLDGTDLDLPYDELWLAGVCLWGFVAARTGRLDEAARLYDLLVPWSGQHSTAFVAMAESVDHCLGELAAALGHPEQADHHFTDAEAGARRLQAPFFVARTLIERARLDFDVGEPDRAAPRLDEAQALAARYGYAGIDRDAQAVAAAAR